MRMVCPFYHSTFEVSSTCSRLQSELLLANLGVLGARSLWTMVQGWTMVRGWTMVQGRTMVRGWTMVQDGQWLITYGIGPKFWPNPVRHPITEFGRLDKRLTSRVIIQRYIT